MRAESFSKSLDNVGSKIVEIHVVASLYKPARTFLIARLPFVDLRVALRAPFAAAEAFFEEVASIALSGPATGAGATFSGVGTNPEAVASWKGVATAAEDSAPFLLALLLDIGVALPVAVALSVAVPLCDAVPLSDAAAAPVNAAFFAIIERRVRGVVELFFLAAIPLLAPMAFLATDTFLPATLLARADRIVVAFFATAALFGLTLLARAERTDAAFFATEARFAATDLLRAALTRDLISADEACEELFNGAAWAELRSKIAVGNASAPMSAVTMRPRRTRVRLFDF